VLVGCFCDSLWTAVLVVLPYLWSNCATQTEELSAASACDGKCLFLTIVSILLGFRIVLGKCPFELRREQAALTLVLGDRGLIGRYTCRLGFNQSPYVDREVSKIRELEGCKNRWCGRQSRTAPPSFHSHAKGRPTGPSYDM
jgi:hypothetical protein